MFQLNINFDEEQLSEYFEIVCRWSNEDEWGWKEGYIIDGVLLIPGQHSEFESQNNKSKVPVKDTKDSGKIKKQDKPQKGIIGSLFGKISNIMRP